MQIIDFANNKTFPVLAHSINSAHTLRTFTIAHTISRASSTLVQLCIPVAELKESKQAALTFNSGKIQKIIRNLHYSVKMC